MTEIEKAEKEAERAFEMKARINRRPDKPFDFFWDTWSIYLMWFFVAYNDMSLTGPFFLFAAIVVGMLNRIFRRQDALAERQHRLSQLIHFVKDRTPFENIPMNLHSDSFSEYL